MTEDNIAAAPSNKWPEWTIMVYIAGDNNLSAHSIAIMQELEAAVAGSDDVRVVAAYDSNAPLPKGARYLAIKHGRKNNPKPNFNWGLHNDLVYPDGHDPFSPDFCNEKPVPPKPIDEPTAKEGLSLFLKWALKYHRAHRHILILFGHGVIAAGNTFLIDTNPPSFLRLADFSEVIKEHFGNSDDGRKPRLDILACDNCVMNAVEAAHEIKDNVDFMIGSQDLMLAVGWPFRKIVDVVQRKPKAKTRIIARRILKACARRLLDYTLMERSSEQAVCDLRQLRDHSLENAVKDLAKALKDGLKTDYSGKVCYPEIRDAVRLARLEAQSYWDETFVDLYDFCELLLNRSGEYVTRQNVWFKQFEEEFLKAALSKPQNPAAAGAPQIAAVAPEAMTTWFIERTLAGGIWRRIKAACIKVLYEFRLKNPYEAQRKGIVPYSYYVCPDLQYSHGFSIYFPWTLPQDPIIFDPNDRSSVYPPKNYRLITAFDEYRTYSFASEKGTDWAGFLVQFFRATLRNVRMNDYSYKDCLQKEAPYIYEEKAINLREAPAVDLQKSSPDTGEQDQSTRVRIKNYPRRFYLSPHDCKRRCGPYKVEPDAKPIKCDPSDTKPLEQINGKPCVPYLGWSIRGIVAQVIGYPPEHLEDVEEAEEIHEGTLET